jgi:hypothetical protein
MDGFAEVHSERNTAQTAAIAPCDARFGSPCSAMWQALESSEQKGLIALMAELSLRIVRDEGDVRKEVSDDRDKHEDQR